MYRKNVLLIAAVFVLVAAVLVTCTGCDKDDEAQAPATGANATATASGEDAQFMNAYCPIMHNPIDPDKVTDDLVRVYKDQRIAFCCAGCPAMWDQSTDQEKDALLTALETFTENVRGQLHDIQEDAAEQIQDKRDNADEHLDHLGH